MATDFQISGTIANMGYTKGSLCCGYGNLGAALSGYDCVIIPGAMKMTLPTALIKGQAFCGVAGLVTMSQTSTTGGKTICSKQQPFKLDFLTDGFTLNAAAASSKYQGFKLVYWQTTC